MLLCSCYEHRRYVSLVVAACQEALEAALLTWKLFLSCIATASLTQLNHPSYLRT